MSNFYYNCQMAYVSAIKNFFINNKFMILNNDYVKNYKVYNYPNLSNLLNLNNQSDH